MSQLLPRTPHPLMASSANLVVTAVPPKFRLAIAPHSPLAWRLARSHSGTRLLFVSVQVRDTLLIEVTIGLIDCVIVTEVLATNRPIENLTAVRPSPNRSYAAPTRGFQSFHSGTFFTSGKSRAGTHPLGVASTCCAGMYPWKRSNRTP